MLQENLHDASQIIQSILTQQLSIPGAAENVSLLLAAKQFQASEWQNSDLRKILSTFYDYPELTKSLVTEMQILIQDLNL